MAPKVLFDPTPKQNEFIKAVLSGKYRELLYGGAAGGGKSYVVCALIILFARMWPGSRWAIVRRDLPRLRTNLLPTFKKVAPPKFVGRPNQQTWESVCANGSTILFVTLGGESESEIEYDRFRGLEIDGVAFDEVNEIPKAAYETIRSRLSRWSAGEEGKSRPPAITLATCNPTQEWPKAYWYEPWAAGTLGGRKFYLPATVYDNPILCNNQEYMEQQLSLSEEWQRVYLHGDWSVADDPCQLISSHWILDSYRTADVPTEADAPWLGVDPAHAGDDKTIIAGGRGNDVSIMEAHKHVDTQWVAGRVAELMGLHGVAAKRVRVDGVGIGAGVVDALHARGLKVTNFIAGAKAGVHKHYVFKNLRAEGYWSLRERFNPKGKGAITIHPKLPHRAELEADLIAQRYKVDQDKVLAIEPKDQLKKRLGRSPDYSDAVMMGLAMLGGDAADKLKRLSAW